MRRFNSGDASAFVEIVTRYRDKMFTLALSRLRNHADAEEIAQDTFIRAHRALADFRGESSLATWLHRIALNLSLNRYWYFFRRRRHQTQSLDCPLGFDSSVTLAEVLSDGDPDPAREAMAQEFTALVANCMTQLPAAQREILQLRNERHQSYATIARALELNIGTVKSRIGRARDQLQRLLADACSEFAPGASSHEWFDAIRTGNRWRLAATG